MTFQRCSRAYQRFVKTTPNPKATKNSNGELVGPLLPPPDPPLFDVGVADCADEVVDVDIVIAPGGCR